MSAGSTLMLVTAPTDNPRHMKPKRKPLPEIRPVYTVSTDKLIVEVPLKQIVTAVENWPGFPMRVTDVHAFAAYLARTLQKSSDSRSPGYEPIAEEILSAIGSAFEDATYMGAGVRSLVEDTDVLVDQMWQEHTTPHCINDFRGQRTIHECVVEAIRAARSGDRETALRWLVAAQDESEDVRAEFQRNADDVIDYAVATYGHLV